MYFYKLPEEAPMSLRRIKGILLQEYFITMRSLEVINDIFLFPIFVNIIIFGLFTAYLSTKISHFDPRQILIGMILWQPIFVASYSITVGTLWNVWSQNLTNMFITPITTAEYIAAYGFSGMLKALIVVIISFIITKLFFQINFLSLGFFNLVLFTLNLTFFGFSFGIFVLGLIFRYGNRIQSLSWALIGMMQPLFAVIYPVSILPTQIRIISLMFPPTYIFEAMRGALQNSPDVQLLIMKAILLNIIYFIFAITFFTHMYKKSREIGQFAKLEG